MKNQVEPSMQYAWPNFSWKNFSTVELGPTQTGVWTTTLATSGHFLPTHKSSKIRNFKVDWARQYLTTEWNVQQVLLYLFNGRAEKKGRSKRMPKLSLQYDPTVKEWLAVRSAESSDHGVECKSCSSSS